MRELPHLLFYDSGVPGAPENTQQRARQDVEGILEKECLHAKDALSVEHDFSTLPVMPDRDSIWPYAVKHLLPQVEYEVVRMIRTLCQA